MQNEEQRRLHHKILAINSEYQELVDILQKRLITNPVEVFKLKRKLITIYREKNNMIEQFKNLSV
jgi:hypothetical protein